MVRPTIPRRLRFNPGVFYFKPRGIPMKTLQEIELFPDELEAIKLHNVDNLDQTSAAQKMQISQPTFARILNRAHQKIAQAIIHGKAIKITQKI